MVSHALHGPGTTVPHAELLALGRMMPVLTAAGVPARHGLREGALILMARIQHARMILKTSWDRWFRMEQQELFELEALGVPSR
jgi:hypothetical protein